MMPLIEVTLVGGRRPAQIRSLIHELHQAVMRTLDAPNDAVRVIVHEVPATHWAAGDVTIAERESATPAEPFRQRSPGGTTPRDPLASEDAAHPRQPFGANDL